MKKNIIVIIIAFFVGAGLSFAHLSKKLYMAAKEVSTEIINDIVDDIYPCKLVVIYRNNQEEESMMTDFSRYKEKGIIGITLNKTTEGECEE